MDHAAFYKKQISLTEWLQKMNHAGAEAMSIEDNNKRERLRHLKELIGLPFDQPQQFEAKTVIERGTKFQAFLKTHGHELCAIRVIPHDPALPKLRMRGKTINDALDWLAGQTINPSDYRIDFVPHAERTNWATIFVVNHQGVFGEITRGGHNELTQGYYEAHTPIGFSWDFDTWNMDQDEPAALEHLKVLLAHLRVADADKQSILAAELDATFAHNYLEGYFESTASDQFGIWFIDYNRILGRLYQTPLAIGDHTKNALVSGQAGSPGKATGRIRIVEDIKNVTLNPGEILVCRMTTPDYLPLMQQAAAIVTDLGGILSHAAIIARELGKPCLTATRDATTKLKDGQRVTVDADAGIVRLEA
ncbi:MAG: hypothetical protein JWN01_476 [Patescibacteria group bacterium]|nr:hypothetical protein [Patescibacteria group bacterium]